MCSTASVADFDSDEDDYPHDDSDIGVSSSSNCSSSNGSGNTRNSPSNSVHEFGKFVETYGWIQCQSKSDPDRVYYHNTWSGCTTWYRPVSRYMDIPFVSIRRANCMGDTLESANDLELMSVSDNEKKSKQTSTRDCDKLIDAMDIAAKYYTPQIPSADDSRSSTDASDCYKGKEDKRQAEINDENNNIDSSPMYAPNFLEAELSVEDNEETGRTFNSLLQDDTSSESSLQTGTVIYDVPRLKRIDVESLLIKSRRTRVTKSRKEAGRSNPGRVKEEPRKKEIKPRKIVSDMHGVRTISYDLPEPGEVCAAMGVKTTTLSASDSDSVPPSPSRRAKTSSEWHDIENLHQPLLSDSSSSTSSTSSWSDTTTSSSSCSCSSCSRRT